MAQFSLEINGETRVLDVDGAMPLLWALRDELALTGTKYGCGIGMCGACTVHVDGEAVRSCQTQVADVKDKKVTTIEGLGIEGLAARLDGVHAARAASGNGSEQGAANALHVVQRAWIEEQVPQCGY